MTSAPHPQHMPLSSFDEITAVNANAVLEQLLHCTDENVNLSTIQRCDSIGIAVLLEAKISRGALNKNTVYSDAPEQLCELASFLKVSDILFK